MKTSITIARAFFILARHTSAAEGQTRLPPQAAAAILADGAPWSAEAPNGRRKFDLTLNPDGTGRMRGPLFFSQNVNWRVEGPTICLASPFLEKCLEFREIPDGLQGWENGEPDLRLRR
ncbi:hypothetical protein [Acuticoccus sediminis]|uniref:hypothetical protein n=1 Tax=Acuticoccus sediminis TaxID=2184697 RepID=UPI001CFDE0B6|nr:hypothetical protein [Acuticoccus sediminis]